MDEQREAETDLVALDREATDEQREHENDRRYWQVDNDD